jgi:hypothetical protein
MNAIIQAIRALARGENLSGGPGVLVKQVNESGVAISGTARSQSGTGGGYVPPFTCSVSDGKLSITPGYVNQLVPTISGVVLDADPAPTLSLVAGLNRVYLMTHGAFTYDPNTGTWVEPNRAVVLLNPSSPTDVVNATGWTAYLKIAEVTMEQGDEGLVRSVPLQSFIQNHLTAANFGPVNAYY